MKMYYKILILLLSGFTSCSELFEFSPFDINLPDRLKKLNIKNQYRLSEMPHDDTLKFAIIADIHSFYDDLENAVDHINSNPDIDLVFVNGDLTDIGLLKEYVLTFDRLEQLSCPYFAVIGNHDYLSNGEKIFREIFEKSNYSLHLTNIQFIIFNDIYWENNNTPPSLDWLENILLDNNHKLKILLTHIPVWGDCFPLEISSRFEKILIENDVKYAFFGHNHNYENYIKEGINYIVTGSVGKKYYQLVTIFGDYVQINKTCF